MTTQTQTTANKTRVVHCRRDAFDICVGRQNDRWGLAASPFRNPYEIGKHGTRTEVIQKFRAYLYARPALLEQVRRELRGKVLGCWCAPLACHGDVLAEIADGEVAP